MVIILHGGETSTKNKYISTNSLTYGKAGSELKSIGIINSTGNLTSSYDAASTYWGESWRMPTKTEWQELSDKCTWTWTTQNETYGYKVTGPNGQSIFFPAAGNKGEVLYSSGEVGAYWSSTVYSSTDYALDKDDAYSMNFNNRYHNVDWGYRIYGKSVRPVTE